MMKTLPDHTKGYELRIDEREPGHTILFISGRIALDNMKVFLADAKNILDSHFFTKLDINLGAISYLDSAGALALFQLEEDYAGRSIPVTYHDITDEIQGILHLLRQKAHDVPPLMQRETPTFFEQAGESIQRILDDFSRIMSFVGRLIIALKNSLLNPRKVRWNDVLFYMKSAGADGLPIVGLISFLMGLIMAFMSSLQLRQFGANIFVASLVALAMVKELGPIMTAILVAGRSGSAFAAEIGTMIINDEVNALKTMGFDPIRFLAVPKVIAVVIVVPLLTLYSDVFAILGGMVVGVVGLDLTVYTYILQTRNSIHVFDIVASLVKAVVFALLIAGIGCQRGFQVTKGAESVGMSTTSAVVSAIFLIIVADSAFAIVLHYIK